MRFSRSIDELHKLMSWCRSHLRYNYVMFRSGTVVPITEESIRKLGFKIMHGMIERIIPIAPIHRMKDKSRYREYVLLLTGRLRNDLKRMNNKQKVLFLAALSELTDHGYPDVGTKSDSKYIINLKREKLWKCYWLNHSPTFNLLPHNSPPLNNLKWAVETFSKNGLREDFSSPSAVIIHGNLNFENYPILLRPSGIVLKKSCKDEINQTFL